MKKIFLLLLLAVAILGCKENKQSFVKDTTHEKKIDALISKMTLEEKIGQTNLRGVSSRAKSLPENLKESVKKGNVGAFLNIMNLDYVDELQRLAIEESPNGIPLIFGRDVIHGFKTIFPIPLGLAATWNAQIVEKTSEISAFEASAVGIRWTFAPMLDIARDSRWGRVAESPGEDPYLATILGAAYVKGFQGEDLSNPFTMAASAKHYIGYGAAIGGRDYNTVNLNEPLLRNVYLPPFKAAVDAGSATVMSAFNEINGIPATGNKFLLKDVLRDELHFDGFVVSDWDSVIEMVSHGFASDEKHSAELAAKAGLDMEMTSQGYEHHLKELIEEKKVTIEELNEFVRNILRVKFRLGLFENPYRNKEHTGDFYAENHLKEAKKAAIESTVLLKNKNSILPISEKTNVAIIGPLANAPHEQLGTWAFDGEKEHTNTPLHTYQKENSNFKFAKGLDYSRDTSTKGFKEAIDIAKKSDVILFFGGEEAILSGEAHSRANMDLPGIQEELIHELAKTGKPIVLIIMAGRPITITNIIDKTEAVLMAWHPGTMGGEALYEIINGIKAPEGRLPVTWPKTAGQLPYFYNHKNTGRPADSTTFVSIDKIPIGAWQSSLGNKSHYLDAGFTPHFPFGYGLSYTTYKYSNLTISKNNINFSEDLEVKFSLTNTGTTDGKEITQLYIQDIVGSITRPIKELKRFQHVFLKRGETKEVSFKISSKDLEFVNHEIVKAAEEGQFNLWVGPNAAQGLKTSFTLKNK